MVPAPPRTRSQAHWIRPHLNPSGYILTNSHVIENARGIKVGLSDSRRFSARLVGRDTKTDLAVLKIETTGSPPLAELGDSDCLQTAQW